MRLCSGCGMLTPLNVFVTKWYKPLCNCCVEPSDYDIARLNKRTKDKA